MTQALPQTSLTRDPRIRIGLCIFAALASVPPLLSLAGLEYYTSVVTRMMIYAIAALSLDLILGYGALVSFGHAAFFGIGAYAALFLASDQSSYVTGAEIKDSKLDITLRPGADSAPIIASLMQNGVLVDEVRKGRASLEEAFLDLVEEEEK